jgi:hypothetical protein
LLWQINPALANLYYDVLVLSVGTPDLDYLRWSFVYSFCELGLSRYRMDSKLGEGGVFSIEGGIPTVQCVKDSDIMKETMVNLANHLIREIHQVVPAVSIKRVPITPAAQQTCQIQVTKVSHKKRKAIVLQPA